MDISQRRAISPQLLLSRQFFIAIVGNAVAKSEIANDAALHILFSQLHF